MPQTTGPRCAAIFAFLVLWLSSGVAGALAQENAQENARAEDAQPRQIPAPARLGLRCEVLRTAMSASETVVLVPDGESYLAAISRWRPTLRFPVLIDDGSVQTREDIARFVRAYEPKRVLRWRAREPVDGHDSAPVRLPGTNPQRQEAIERALVASWGLDQPLDALYDLWRGKDQFAPGVVVAHPGDPAWPAALALASFRAQPIVWAYSPKNPNGKLSREQVEEICEIIETGCERLEFPWKELGDQIDAVALCLNAPAKYAHAKGEIRATTDRIGRLADDTLGETRWAFTSQIFGDEAQSSYAAMCGLFLTSQTALLFDGYENKPPYSNYELASARPMLESGGFSVIPFAPPTNGRDRWLIIAARALDAGLIFVNTHGMRDAFNLSPGRLRPGSLPILTKPAMIHFIHSWSAVRPGDRATVAGRWFERGAYAYYGSVDEPYLQAFVPPSQVVARMRGAFPWAAGVRIKESPVWKLACFGDPLVTLGAPLSREDTQLGLEGAEDLAESAGLAAREERFADALEALSLLGRDEDALRLIRALAREKPEAITPDLAAVALFAAGRKAPPSEFFAIYARLADERSRDPYLLDHLWNLVRLRLTAPGEDDRALIAYLRTRLREDQRGEDASDLARAIAQLQSPGAAVEFLDSIEPRNQRERQVLLDARRDISSR